MADVENPDMLRWLQGPGQKFLESAASTDPTNPADVTVLRRGATAEQVHAALQCWQLRRRATDKFSRAERMFFDPLALEQATSESIARHKAARFVGLSMVADLCCGIGGDALGLALAGCNVTCADRALARVAMTRANLHAYDVDHRAWPICCDVRQWIPSAPAYHIDPSRRDPSGHRTPAIDSEPNLMFLRQLVREREHVAVKLSPGEPFEALRMDGELEVISEHGVCKQAVLWCGRFAKVHRRATLLPAGLELTADESDLRDASPQVCSPQDAQVIYEPDGAIIRAGLIGVLARRFGWRILDHRLAYLAGEPTDQAIGFAHGYHVLEAGHWSLVHVRRRLRAHNVGQVTIKKRGMNIDPDVLSARLRTDLPGSAVLILARVGQQPCYWLTEPLMTQ